MARSICPSARSRPNSQTPKAEPAMPPTSSTPPILKSTWRRRQWAMKPDTEAATTWLTSEPTATGGGTPMKMSNGVIRKPPPTPNRPDRKPTAPPMPSSRKMSTDISAIGR